MDTFSRSVARRVAAALKAAGVSERSLARTTGISRDRLRSRLHEELPFTTRELFAVAQAIGVDPADLMGDAS